MIPKEWRDYKIEFRPFVIIAWLVCSPAVLLPVMWFYTRENIDWPAWVQAVGSLVAIAVAVSVSSRQHARDQRWREADNAERNRAMALRLDAFMTEYHRLICKVLPIDKGSAAGDKGIAGLLEVLQARLDRNFDDDFDHERQIEIYNTRSCLAAAIFALKHTTDRPEDQADRAGLIEDLRKNAQGSFDNARKLYSQATEKYKSGH